MMTKEEKILCALYGIKSVLNDLGLEDIKNKLELKDGSTETIDCVNVLQEFVVNYVNSTQAHKVNEWIPVKEKMPKNYENVLVSCDNGEVDYGFYSDDHFVLDYIDDEAYPVIAWMPLPESYKGKD